jgi:hypothetical protein
MVIKVIKLQNLLNFLLQFGLNWCAVINRWKSVTTDQCSHRVYELGRA